MGLIKNQTWDQYGKLLFEEIVNSEDIEPTLEEIARQSAIQKLSKLGLTEEEIAALIS